MTKTKTGAFRTGYQPTVTNMVTEFHKAFANAIDEPITLQELNLRLKLITEEYDEVMEAGADLAEAIYGQLEYPSEGAEDEIAKLSKAFLKETTDLVYVTVAPSVTFGWDFDRAYRLTHLSNMSKLNDDGQPEYNDSGKILKGPNYKPPEYDDYLINNVNMPASKKEVEVTWG